MLFRSEYVRTHPLTQDRIDFYVHRDRAKLERQLVAQLQLSRTMASQHLAELMAAAEEWDNKVPVRNSASHAR